MALFANFFTDYTEENLILSTDNIKGVTFSTQLPGGFGDGGLVLPTMYFNKEDWRDRVLGRHLVLTDAAGSRVYEGFVEGVEDGEDGLGIQAVGQYSKAGLKTVYLAYPTAPVNLVSVFQDAVDLVDSWRSQLIVSVSADNFVSQIPLEFLHEVKVQEMIEKILKENTINLGDGTGYVAQFAIYDHLRPYLFHALTPWYKVARRDMSLTYGSTVSLSGTYNKIQVLYDVEGEKRFTDWYEDTSSQSRYGTREGTLSAGSVPEGVAQVAGELAISRYAKPDEVETLTIHGQVNNYYTNAPTDAYWLRAGQMLFVTDIPANPSSRFAFNFDRDQAGFLVMHTTYNGDDNSLTVDVGDGFKTLEQYMVDMGISGGDVR